jgi:hypothetical protein
MESDSLRTRGDTTLAEMWIDGKVRVVTITHEAIDAFLGLAADVAAAMTDEDRREFVRGHLTLVATAAKALLRATDPAAEVVTIGPGALGTGASASGERRQGDRRSGIDRRTGKPVPPDGDRSE